MDLPWHGRQVQIRWRSRRFFCDTDDCSKRIFTERLPEVASAHARTTTHMTQALRAIGLSCGGEGGGRLARRLGIPTSPDRLLSMVRRIPRTATVTPRILGVDDWAFRRGHQYGTILCDLERHCPIDLLPERSSESFQAWLQSHPGVEVISRDRGDYYIKGAAIGAPNAIQVADRWHLLTNLREALMRAADRFPQQILEAARAAATHNDVTVHEANLGPAIPPENTVRLTRSQQLQQARRAQRLQRFEQVHELKRNGVPGRAIARLLGIHRSTVRRFLNTSTFPERAKRVYHSKADSLTDHLRRRWEEGCHNAAQLTHELRQRGFTGSYCMIRRRVARWCSRPGGESASMPSVSNQKKIERPSSNRIAWLLLYPPADIDDRNYLLVEKLRTACPELAAASRLATKFVSMLKKQRATALDAWVRNARQSKLPEIRRFAEGLRSDWKAVKAAIALPWSNGQTEGHVNRLKTIKRQMYGRAKFDLLRQRVLNAA